MDDDFMELGDTGWVPIKDGWFYNVNTQRKRDPEGKEYTKYGELLYDPKEDNDG